ncbi:hypothetical protein HYPSUDRAFT_195909 [Hypholoma sublateritium FD-334 SS-4]|uniref:NACHT domain-containing protein n=1 Tax=Hypholoma sublateritium (strain FD-334 SS-4) TaxID=945553 RepID=A0A0D2LPF5_HYPSF|nr:hypothetical protein HYPSUDRAFT_195909 [Hypholoma sublateritium FD-334 SS-4]
MRTVKIQGSWKFCIEQCQASCSELKAKLSERVQLDTNAAVHHIDQNVETIINRDLVQDIHQWLSPPDSSINQNEAYEKHQSGTCSWFLTGDQYIKWKDTPGFLWVKGKAGCGKSILSSLIIDDLSKNSAFNMAYFFFDSRDGQSDLQLYNKLIRCLISQFANMHQKGVPVELANLYKNSKSQQSLDKNLENILDIILSRLSHTYIVIDALDECTERRKTLDWLLKLVQKTSNTVHILVTSRPLLDIEKAFKKPDILSVNIEEKAVNSDIAKYLKVQMKSKFEDFEESTIVKIESVLTEKAEGSFRWISLQLNALENCQSKAEILKQLERLPKDLNATYNKMLQAIDTNYIADTMAFLQWLAFSLRPMTVAELADIITIDFDSPNGPVFNKEKRYNNPQSVLVRCSGLVNEANGK